MLKKSHTNIKLILLLKGFIVVLVVNDLHNEQWTSEENTLYKLWKLKHVGSRYVLFVLDKKLIPSMDG